MPQAPSEIAPALLPDTEASALFNPAFCAVLLNRAIAAFTSQDGAPMPLTFAYLILPSAMHRPTREALPKTSAASMPTWLRENPLVLSQLPVRVRAFRDYTSQAIIYGLNRRVLVDAPDGALLALSLRRRPRTLRPTQDWEACVRAADFLGRWVGTSGSDEPTTLAQWGLRP